MSKYRKFEHDSTVLHDVPLDELRDAILYLGGMLVEGAAEQRPSEVQIVWSPRVAPRVQQQLRATYSGWRAIPVYVVNQIMEAQRAGREAFALEQQAQIQRSPCISCKDEGVATLATVEVFGAVSFCEPCSVDMLALQDKLGRPVAIGFDCVRCHVPIMRDASQRDQLRVCGKFIGLCPACWRSRKSNGLVMFHRGERAGERHEDVLARMRSFSRIPLPARDGVGAEHLGQ